MLRVTPEVVNIIADYLDITAPITVIYNDGTDLGYDNRVRDGDGPSIYIFHRGNHFFAA
jgi:hypothetical protein